MSLEGDAPLVEFACQPQPTVEADANGERKPALHPDVAEPEAFVEEVVVQVGAANGFLAGFDEAFLVPTQPIRHPGFLTGEQSDASAGAAMLLREFHRQHVLVDLGTVEMHDRNVFAVRSPGAPRVALVLDATPIRGADGRAQGALLVLRDVGEEERAAAFREAFLARAGHELRNPLGALTTATQILARRAKKRGDPPDRALEIVLESVGNLTKLVEELLDLSRIGRGRFELERTPNIPLGSILVAAAEDTRRRFPESNVEVLVAGDICSGNWDPARLRQAVRHLLENAIVHGKPPVDVKVVTLGVESVVLRVRDHGDGIPAERREEVLRPFVRRDRNVGLGLGLAIVSEIARAHGGRCWIGETEDGRAGCAAFVELPFTAGT